MWRKKKLQNKVKKYLKWFVYLSVEYPDAGVTVLIAKVPVSDLEKKNTEPLTQYQKIYFFFTFREILDMLCGKINTWMNKSSHWKWWSITDDAIFVKQYVFKNLT